MQAFEEEIYEDIKWREEQLLMIKTLPRLYSFSDSHKELIIKNAFLNIYALWEGYVQNSFQIYVRELNRLELKRNEVTHSILYHTIDCAFPQLKEYPEEFHRRLDFIVKLNDFFDETFKISSKINTESNVGLEVLNRILRRFNFVEIENYPYKNQLKSLLMYRNHIAHGNMDAEVNSSNLVDSQKKVDEFVDLIKTLMQLVFEKISDGYSKDKCYLKQPVTFLEI